jgi:hypothetical protein
VGWWAGEAAWHSSKRGGSSLGAGWAAGLPASCVGADRPSSAPASVFPLVGADGELGPTSADGSGPSPSSVRRLAREGGEPYHTWASTGRKGQQTNGPSVSRGSHALSLRGPVHAPRS